MVISIIYFLSIFVKMTRVHTPQHEFWATTSPSRSFYYVMLITTLLKLHLPITCRLIFSCTASLLVGSGERPKMLGTSVC